MSAENVDWSQSWWVRELRVRRIPIASRMKRAPAGALAGVQRELRELDQLIAHAEAGRCRFCNEPAHSLDCCKCAPCCECDPGPARIYHKDREVA